ncbi:MAG TPA: amidohydrolase family protein [Acidimicrobiales bacterium]
MTTIVNGLDYAVVDADNHYYEPPDCFSRHIESAYRDKAITATKRDDEGWTVMIGSEPYTFFDPKFDRTNPPGSLLTVLRAKDANAEVKWADFYSKENMLPAFQNRDERLVLMDEQGIEATIMLPSFGVSVTALMLDDVEQMYANLTAFNRWLEEDWGYGADGRIFSPPLISLLDPDRAVAELDRVLALGAKVVAVPPGPTGSMRSPADPIYDPFWSRLDESGVALVLHLGDSLYPETSAAWGEIPYPPVREMSAFQWAFNHSDRPIMETIGQFIYGNLFGRFPNLKVLSIENGSDWVPYLLRLLDKKKGLGRYGPWIGGRPVGRPSDTFKQHVWVAPYPEDDVDAVIDVIGADRVLFGSDYPHPEGMAEPAHFADLMKRAAPDDVRKVMRDNSAELLGIA